MFKLYLTSILVAEVVALAALEVMSPGVRLVLYLVPIIPLTLVVALIFAAGSAVLPTEYTVSRPRRSLATGPAIPPQTPPKSSPAP